MSPAARDSHRQRGAGNDAWEAALVAWLGDAHDALQRASAADLATWLPDDLLVKYDRMAMAVSLEGRAPFLQPDLVAAALALPPAERMNGDESKVALRRVARRFLPERIHRRKKAGIRAADANVDSRMGRSARRCRGVFRRALPGIDPAELIAVVDADLAAGVARERLLFALIMFAEWAAASRERIAARYAAPPPMT